MLMEGCGKPVGHCIVGSVDGEEVGKGRRKSIEDTLGCSLFHTYCSKFPRE